MRIIGLSDANIIGIHSMAIIAAAGSDGISVHKIADLAKCSKNHLTKVVEILSKEGLIHATRGPAGGFYLSRTAKEIYLIDIYEAISGKVDENNLCYEHSSSRIKLNFFTSICTELSQKYLNYLKNTKLSEIQGKAEQVLRKQ
ncbi:MAG TPA: Rrf2 family transcriptional regulator [Bacteroidales bacterium]|mgnify:CR=1 FL=1|nr:Rrf2 family transcriptional regulator [Bacteroidales bacterium]